VALRADEPRTDEPRAHDPQMHDPQAHDPQAHDPWTHLFGEGAGAFVVSGPADAVERLAERAPLEPLGTVGGDVLDCAAGDMRVVRSLDELRAGNAGALAELLR
jgi:hypothetical protein